MPGIYVVSHGDEYHDTVACVSPDLAAAGRAAWSLVVDRAGSEIRVSLWDAWESTTVATLDTMYASPDSYTRFRLALGLDPMTDEDRARADHLRSEDRDNGGT